MIRTMEDILGIGRLNLNDAVAIPMADVFDIGQKQWNFTAAPSPLLYNTQLPLPVRKTPARFDLRPTHDSAYWAAATRGLDFSGEDKLDGAAYNRILWTGLKATAYNPSASGANLRHHRADLLAHYLHSHSTADTSSKTNAAVGGGQ